MAGGQAELTCLEVSERVGVQADPKECIVVRAQRALENRPGASQPLPFQRVQLGVQRLRGGSEVGLPSQQRRHFCRPWGPESPRLQLTPRHLLQRLLVAAAPHCPPCPRCTVLAGQASLVPTHSQPSGECRLLSGCVAQRTASWDSAGAGGGNSTPGGIRKTTLSLHGLDPYDCPNSATSFRV